MVYKRVGWASPRMIGIPNNSKMGNFNETLNLVGIPCMDTPLLWRCCSETKWGAAFEREHGWTWDKNKPLIEIALGWLSWATVPFLVWPTQKGKPQLLSTMCFRGRWGITIQDHSWTYSTSSVGHTITRLHPASNFWRHSWLRGWVLMHALLALWVFLGIIGVSSSCKWDKLVYTRIVNYKSSFNHDEHDKS